MTSQHEDGDVTMTGTTAQVQTVRVEGCSRLDQVQVTVGSIRGWREEEIERDRETEAAKRRFQAIKSTHERRKLMIHLSPARARENAQQPRVANQRPHRNLRKPRIRSDVILLDGVSLSSLTQFDLAASVIISPSSLEGLGIAYHLWVAVKKTLADDVSLHSIKFRDDDHKWELLSDSVFEQMMVELGTTNADRIAPIPHRRKEIHLFIDPRKSADVQAIMRSARRMSALFRHQNTHGEIDLFISIPATQEGIQASHELERIGIKTNLTQVSSLDHALICSTYAGASCVTMDIASILKWFERREKTTRGLAQHGIEQVRTTARYLRFQNKSQSRTRVLGENFRTAAEIGLLAGDLDGIVLNQTTLEDITVVTLDKRHFMRPTYAGMVGRLPAASSSVDNNDDCGNRNAQLGSEPLGEVDPDLMRALSAESQSIFAGTMFTRLGAWKVHMNKIQKVVQEELRRQAELKMLNLRELYTSWGPRRDSGNHSKETIVSVVQHHRN